MIALIDLAASNLLSVRFLQAADSVMPFLPLKICAAVPFCEIESIALTESMVASPALNAASFGDHEKYWSMVSRCTANL